MKIAFCSMLLFVNALAQGLPAPGTITEVDIDKDGMSDLKYACAIDQIDATRSEVRYEIFGLLNCDILIQSSSVRYFQFGQTIRSTFSIRTPSEMLLTGYLANNSAQGWLFSYVNFPGNLNAVTDGIAGFRLRRDDGYHVGWVRFTRPDTEVQTPFSVAGWDYNPVPDAPIGAGLPPEVPVTSEVLPDDGGLKLSWPAGASSWILESTPNLTLPITWEPYPAAGTYTIVPLDEAGRYFRLRRP